MRNFVKSALDSGLLKPPRNSRPRASVPLTRSGLTKNVAPTRLARVLNFPGCLLIVSHDRYFMDKIVEHVFVFDGNGVVKDFPGNYSVYRNKKNKTLKSNTANKIKTNKAEKPKPISGRLSYNEKYELEQIEKELKTLEKQKTELEQLINSGTLNSKQLIEKSQEFGNTLNTIENKELRWLELSEKG